MNFQTDSKADASIGVLTNSYYYSGNPYDLTSISNSFGQFVNYGYNSGHEIVAITNALQQITTLSWDVGNTWNLLAVQPPSGKQINLSYYGANFTPLPTYLQTNMLQNITITPEGRSITVNNYLAGQPSNLTDDRSLTLSMVYDGLDRLTSVTFPDATTTVNTYNRLDLASTKDRLGNLTQYSYDGLQHLTSLIDANNKTTTYSWCGCGSLNQIIDPFNAASSPTTFTYDNQGNRTSVTYPDNASWTYTYDLTRRLVGLADGASRSWQIGYNNQGLVTSVANSFGTVRQTVYDAMNRPVSVTDANGITINSSYDLINELTKRTWPDNVSELFVYNAKGLASYVNRDQQTTAYTRDAAGRLLSLTNPNNEVTQFTYDSLNDVLTMIDGLNHQTTWQYNLYGWLTTKTDGNNNQVLNLTYDADGHVLTRRTPAKGQTSYVYDPVGNLTSITYPLTAPNATITYAYDALNRLTQMMDVTGTTTLGYTAASQLQTETETGTWLNYTLTSSYTQQQRTGLSLTQPSGPWSESYTYDTARRLGSITTADGTYTYTRAALGAASPLVQSLSLPNTSSQTYGYDALARLNQTTLRNHSGVVLDQYAYGLDPLGLRTSETRTWGAASSTATILYDNLGQLLYWSAYEANGTTPRNQEQLFMVYDAADNLTLRENNNLYETFTVDKANQLSGVSRSGTLTVAGNLQSPASSVTVNGQSASAYADLTYSSDTALANGQNTYNVVAKNSAGNQVSSTVTVNLPTSVVPTYDGNGNLTSDGLKNYAYDAENEVTNVWVAGQWQSYFLYDGLGRRRVEQDFSWNGSIWVKNNETHYIYDGTEILQERNVNNTPLVTYTRGLDVSGSVRGAGGIGGLLARTDANGTTYYHADGSGNVTALINGSQNIVARYLYNPFGQVLGKWGGMADANEMQFSSMPVHASSGLSLYPYRAYNPSLQRWLSRDPIGEFGGFDLYAYVANNPINYYDPYGLYSWSEWGQIIGAGTGSWSDSANSIGHTLGDVTSGNWGDIGNNYDSSSLGQAESIGGGVYTAEKYSLATAAVATAGTFSIPAMNAAALVSDGVIHSGDGNGGKKPCPPTVAGTTGGAGPVRRVTNPKHHPNSNSPEPKNADDLFNRAIEDENGVRWSIDDDGTIHRFSKPSNGESHWNGSTDGADPILRNNIPNDVLEGLEL